MLRIGLSACFFHADPKRAVFKGKTLAYAEQSMAHWVGSQGDLVYLIPAPRPDGPSIAQYVDDLDGLVLQGGSDLSPITYGEKPLKPEWSGDRIRDVYEIELVREFTRQGKPVLGICRGLQLLNVAYGGKLYQDITEQVPGSLVHRDWEVYDTNHHEIELSAGLAEVFKTRRAKVNSVHHQGVKELGKGLVVEAKSTSDGIIEGFRHSGPEWVCGVQWHPEFHDPKDPSYLDSKPLLQSFIDAACVAKKARRDAAKKAGK